MVTEYGYRDALGRIQWVDYEISREKLEQVCKRYGFTMLARDVSDARTVSIRA